MKTEITVQSTEQRASISTSVQVWLSKDNELLTAVMADAITNRQALLIYNVLLAVSLLISVTASVTVTVVIAVYFLCSLYLCYKFMRHGK